jgi:retinol dehydrogenase-12
LKAIESIKEAVPDSAGDLVFLRLDLADLTQIKKAAAEFLSKETKLHVLFNNAGVMCPDQGSKSAQGYELQLGVNNVGTFMLTKLLTPILVATAKTETPGTVRVVWVSSSGAELGTPTPIGVIMDNLDYHNDKSAIEKYAISKGGNYLHSAEFAKRYEADGVVSVALNPGNLASELYRNQWAVVGFFLRTFILYPSIFGAYTELFAGLSQEVTIKQSGSWSESISPDNERRCIRKLTMFDHIVVPWGRFMDIRKDLIEASKTKAEGGSGVAEAFWEWSEEQVKPYL